MDKFSDERINEALELLNAVAKDKKTDLQAAIRNKYSDLSAVVGSFGDQVKARASERFTAGKEKVVDVATDVDKHVHENPWPYIGGAALGGLLLGLLLNRSRRD